MMRPGNSLVATNEHININDGCIVLVLPVNFLMKISIAWQSNGSALGYIYDSQFRVGSFRNR